MPKSAFRKFFGSIGFISFVLSRVRRFTNSEGKSGVCALPTKGCRQGTWRYMLTQFGQSYLQISISTCQTGTYCLQSCGAKSCGKLHTKSCWGTIIGQEVRGVRPVQHNCAKLLLIILLIYFCLVLVSIVNFAI